MGLEDAATAAAIEALSEPRPSSAEAYRRELATNANAVYFVACVPHRQEDGPRVVGFAGLWRQHDEAHVTMIAVHPDWRGHHIGEQLFVRLLELALELGLRQVTLEVRALNTVAQELYAKYGFVRTGYRPAYYPGDRADAVIMSTPELGDPAWRARFEQLRAELRREVG
jgi:ribosomal-protein-alanine N-acetyltransferase